jgi:peptidoglycan/LPS O-acetylase OafA/YrhL
MPSPSGTSQFLRPLPRIPGPRMAITVTRHHLVIADTMRAVAIFVVVVNHLFLFSHPIIDHRPIRLGYLGVWGVNAFFLLSGFLLGNDYIAAILSGSSLPNMGTFLARRFLRIYPLYGVAIAFSVLIVSAFLHPVSTGTIAQHIFMLQGTVESAVFALNAPLWTMGIDAAFYLALPVYMAALFTIGHARTRRFKVTQIVVSLSLLIILSLSFRYYQAVHFTAVMSSFAALVVNIRTVLGMATAFALGIAISLTTQVVARERFPRSFYGALVGIGVLVAVVELLLRLEEATQRSTVGYLKLTLLDPIAAVSAALILFGLLQGGVPFVSRLSRLPFMAAFAALAYAVYLFHYPILDAFDARVLHGASGPTSLIELAACCIVVVLPIAFAAHLVIEKPFLKLKDRLRNPARIPSP